MSNYDCHACREYNSLSRRQFIGAASGAAVAALTAPAWLPRVAYARQDCSGRDVIISIYLRGGADGLSMVVPFAEPAYYAARPALAIPHPDSGDPHAAVALDDFFAFAPAMAPLVEAYRAGHLLVVHATGMVNATRSHFDAQRFMEVGKAADPTVGTGWLGRHLASVPPLRPDSILRGVGINTGLQRTLVGGPETLPIPNLDQFGLTGSAATLAARRQAISDMYALVDDPLRAAGETTLLTIDLLNQIDFAGYQPKGGAVYPVGAFGLALKSTAALLKAQVGVEAVAIDLGGWDHHNSEGPISGAMADLMTQLSQGLAALHADLFSRSGAGNPNLIVVVTTEFGRRVDENGSGGTDHGYGGAMLVLGGNVAGGRVLAEWPGLAPDQLFEQRDLRVTIDYRHVLAEIVQYRLGNANLEYVFPDFTPNFRGVVCPSTA
jgi:uncharacterized protein (DUF1501 family)